MSVITLMVRTMLSVWFLFGSALFISGLPITAHAQDSNQNDSESNTTVVDSEVTEVHNPYKTEQLLGDKVIGDFVVGPGKIELEIKPGESKTVEITVSNRTGESRIFEIVAEDAVGSQSSSQAIVLLGADRGPYSMKDFVSVDAERFELGQNERARIPVTISIPPDADPGGLYGSVLVSTVTSEAVSGNEGNTAPRSAVISRIGTLFFITVPGEIEHEGSLKEVTTIPKKTWYQSGPIRFGVLFENTGSIHLAPYGELRIKNMFGEEVGFVELEPWFVLPKSLRLREVVWDRAFLLGRYAVTINLNRSYNDIIDTRTIYFWVIPWKIAAGVFLSLFVFFYLIRIFFRKFEFKRK